VDLGVPLYLADKQGHPRIELFFGPGFFSPDPFEDLKEKKMKNSCSVSIIALFSHILILRGGVF